MSGVLSVRLPEPLLERLDALSQATRRTRAVYVREALEAQLDRIEWEQRILKNVEDIRAGRRQTIPQAEARKRLGLED
jgi:RHH-type rel operon transcriptional repressor/antitoxin RelB